MMPLLIKSKWPSHLLLGAILVIALFFRIPNYSPSPTGMNFDAHQDERYFYEHAINFSYGDLNPKWYGTPGSTVIWLEATTYTGLRLLAPSLRLEVPPADARFPGAYAFNEIFLDITRTLYVFLSLIMIVIAKRLTTELAGGRAGWLAAFFLSINPLHTLYSHFLLPDMIGTLLLLGLVHLCIKRLRKKGSMLPNLKKVRELSRLPKFVYSLLKHPKLFKTQHYIRSINKWLHRMKEGGWGTYLWGGLLLGLAVATKYPYVFGALALIGVSIKEKGWWKWIFDLRLWAAALMSGVTFLALNPFFIVEIGTFLSDLVHESRTVNLGADGLSAWGNLKWYLTHTFHWGVGTLLTFFGFLGFGAWLWQMKKKKQWGDLSVLLPFMVMFIFLSTQALHWDRWMIPIVTFWILLTAVGVAWTLERLISLKTKPVAILSSIFLVTMVSFGPLGRSLAFAQAFRVNTNTRAEASVWANAYFVDDKLLMKEDYTASLDEETFSGRQIHVGIIATEGEFTDYRVGKFYKKDGHFYLMISSRNYCLFNEYLEEKQSKRILFYKELFAGNQAELFKTFAPSVQLDFLTYNQEGTVFLKNDLAFWRSYNFKHSEVGGPRIDVFRLHKKAGEDEVFLLPLPCFS